MDIVMRRVNHSRLHGAAHRRERGLALDLGKLYVAKSELSNAADACALAAARDLTGATSLMTSEAAGITVGESNKVLLQSQNVSLAVDSNVTYSEAFDGPYYTQGAYK